jgi:hypothetical protein
MRVCGSTLKVGVLQTTLEWKNWLVFATSAPEVPCVTRVAPLTKEPIAAVAIYISIYYFLIIVTLGKFTHFAEGIAR